MKLRKARKSDVTELLKLYRAVAETKNGIARNWQEISESFVQNFLENSMKKGLIFVIENGQSLIAEIHGHKDGPSCFKHNFGNLTLVVHPSFQQLGLGHKIFSHLLSEIKNQHQDIARVELFVRQKNSRAINLYQSLGFVIEGILKNRIIDSDGKLDSDTLMAWFNPNFIQPN